MSTMLLGGLWHGPSFNFIFWGFLHGAALGIEKFFKEIFSLPKNTFTRAIGVIITFHFVCLCWIFFRAQDFDTANEVISQIFHQFSFAIAGQWITGYSFVVVLLLFGYITHFIPAKTNSLIEKKISFAPVYAQVLLITIVVYTVVQMKSADIHPFIYFQF